MLTCILLCGSQQKILFPPVPVSLCPWYHGHISYHLHASVLINSCHRHEGKCKENNIKVWTLPFGSCFSSQESLANFSFFLLLSQLHLNSSVARALFLRCCKVSHELFWIAKYLLFRSDIDRTVTIFCKILNLQIDGLGANIKILCRSVAESPVCSCCHTIPWKYSKLNLLLKLSLTKKLRSQAEPSSRRHRLTGRVRANARLDPDTELLRGIVQKLRLGCY